MRDLHTCGSGLPLLCLCLSNWEVWCCADIVHAPTLWLCLLLLLVASLQANSVAVQDAAATGRGEVLAVQVLRLRLCVDAMSAQLRNAHSKDLVDNLKAKQALQGRDRLPGQLLL